MTRAYDTKSHAQSASRQTTVVPDDFVDCFAIVGPADRCIERLRAIEALGVERVVVVGAAKDADPKEAEAARRRFATEALPALRQDAG